MDNDTIARDRKDEHRDPISDQPGAHPVGVGVGAASGGVVGGTVGAIGGPIGAGVGMLVGAVAGAYAGKAAAEEIDPTAEDTYWREHFASQPYVSLGDSYDSYRPAYHAGFANFARFEGRPSDEVEEELRKDYEKRMATNGLSWEKAKHAARDAWNRLTN